MASNNGRLLLVVVVILNKRPVEGNCGGFSDTGNKASVALGGLCLQRRTLT